MNTIEKPVQRSQVLREEEMPQNGEEILMLANSSFITFGRVTTSDNEAGDVEDSHVDERVK